MKKTTVNQAISRYNSLLRNPQRQLTVGELTAQRMAAAQLLLQACIREGVTARGLLFHVTPLWLIAWCRFASAILNHGRCIWS